MTGTSSIPVKKEHFMFGASDIIVVIATAAFKPEFCLKHNAGRVPMLLIRQWYFQNTFGCSKMIFKIYHCKC